MLVLHLKRAFFPMLCSLCVTKESPSLIPRRVLCDRECSISGLATRQYLHVADGGDHASLLLFGGKLSTAGGLTLTLEKSSQTLPEPTLQCLQLVTPINESNNGGCALVSLHSISYNKLLRKYLRPLWRDRGVRSTLRTCLYSSFLSSSMAKVFNTLEIMPSVSL